MRVHVYRSRKRMCRTGRGVLLLIAEDSRASQTNLNEKKRKDMQRRERKSVRGSVRRSVRRSVRGSVRG